MFNSHATFIAGARAAISEPDFGSDTQIHPVLALFSLDCSACVQNHTARFHMRRTNKDLESVGEELYNLFVQHGPRTTGL